VKRIEQLQEFLKTDPEDPFLNYALAIEYVGQEDYAKAKEILIDLRAKQPDYVVLYYHLGKLFQREGDKVEAENIYRDGIKRTTMARERHHLAELQTALNNMLYEEE